MTQTTTLEQQTQEFRLHMSQAISKKAERLADGEKLHGVSKKNLLTLARLVATASLVPVKSKNGKVAEWLEVKLTLNDKQKAKANTIYAALEKMLQEVYGKPRHTKTYAGVPIPIVQAKAGRVWVTSHLLETAYSQEADADNAPPTSPKSRASSTTSPPTTPAATRPASSTTKSPSRPSSAHSHKPSSPLAQLARAQAQAAATGEKAQTNLLAAASHQTQAKPHQHTTKKRAANAVTSTVVAHSAQPAASGNTNTTDLRQKRSTGKTTTADRTAARKKAIAALQDAATRTKQEVGGSWNQCLGLFARLFGLSAPKGIVALTRTLDLALNTLQDNAVDTAFESARDTLNAAANRWSFFRDENVDRLYKEQAAAFNNDELNDGPKR